MLYSYAQHRSRPWWRKYRGSIGFLTGLFLCLILALIVR